MTDERVWGSGKIWAARLIVLAVFFVFWEWAAHSKLIDPILIGKPTGIVQYLWQEVFVTQSLLNDFYWSMGGTMIAFVLGSVAGVLVGMLFVTSPSTEAVLNPIFTALNAMPRIALAPLFIIWFGLGLGSKVAVGFSLTFFIVLSSTVAGGRGVNPDHITLARTLGAAKARFPQVRAAERRAGDLQRPAAWPRLRPARRDRRGDLRLRTRPRPDAVGARRKLHDQWGVRHHLPVIDDRRLHQLGDELAGEPPAQVAIRR